MHAIRTAMMESYAAQQLHPFEEVIANRALQYDRLLSKDLLSLPDEEAKKQAAWAKRLGEELIVMDDIRALVRALIEERYAMPNPDDLQAIRREYEHAMKDLYTLRQVVAQMAQENEYLISVNIILLNNVGRTDH